MIYLRENETKIFNQEKPLCKYYFDTMADFADLPGLDRVAPGSDAYCIADQNVYILDSSGVWEVQ